MKLPKILRGIVRSKTMIVAATLAIGGVVEANMAFFSDLMGPKAFGWFSIGVGVVMALLRLSTTTSLSEKGE